MGWGLHAEVGVLNFLWSAWDSTKWISKWDDCEFQVSQSRRLKAPNKAPLFPFFGCACRCCCCCCCCLGCCGWAYCCCMYCCCCCCCCCFCPFLPFPLPSSFPLPHTLSPSAFQPTYVFQSFQAKEKDFFLAEQKPLNFHKQSWQSSINFCLSFLIQTWIPSPHMHLQSSIPNINFAPLQLIGSLHVRLDTFLQNPQNGWTCSYRLRKTFQTLQFKKCNIINRSLNSSSEPLPFAVRRSSSRRCCSKCFCWRFSASRDQWLSSDGDVMWCRCRANKVQHRVSVNCSFTL